MIRQIKNSKRRSNKFIKIGLGIILVSFIFFVGINIVQAAPTTIATTLPFNTGQTVVTIVMDIITFVNSFFGKILTLLMKVLVVIAQYNGFINNTYVDKGWQILRDLVNMFFILGLLVIAFGTVLKLEKYSWNKLLGRLLIMAILINFSKTICGVIIDFFQVIMLTFVNAFKNIAEGNIWKGIGAENFNKLNSAISNPDWEQGTLAIVGSLLALVYTAVAAIVVGIFVILLIYRIVALWLLVVLSPLAFFAWVFGSLGGKNIWGEWWSNFMNYCLVGPFLAFVLWLSILSMASLSGDLSTSIPKDVYDPVHAESQSKEAILGLTFDVVTGYLMSIIMLVAGLTYVQKFGVAGAGLATAAASKIKEQTQGRLERVAKRVATGATVLPATKAIGAIRGVAGGLAERRYRAGGLSKYTTTRGVREAYERRKGGVKARIAGTPIDYREIEATQAEGFGKELARTGRYQTPLSRSFGIMNASKNNDFQATEALVKMQAESGNLSQSEIAFLKTTDRWKKMTPKERTAFGEKYESLNEKNGGGRVVIDEMRYDPISHEARPRNRNAEVSNYVANSKKDSFVDQAVLTQFGNYGHLPGFKTPDLEDKKYGSTWEKAITAQQENSMAQLEGAANNPNVGGLTGVARERKRNALDFYMVDPKTRQDMINNNQVKIEDVFRPRNPNEKPEEQQQACLDYYQKYDPAEKYDPGNPEKGIPAKGLSPERFNKFNQLRKRLDTEYDASGRPVPGGVEGRGFEALGANLSDNVKGYIRGPEAAVPQTPVQRARAFEAQMPEGVAPEISTRPGSERGPAPGGAPPAAPMPPTAPAGPARPAPEALTARAEEMKREVILSNYTPAQQQVIVNNNNYLENQINRTIQVLGEPGIGKDELNNAIIGAVSLITAHEEKLNGAGIGTNIIAIRETQNSLNKLYNTTKPNEVLSNLGTIKKQIKNLDFLAKG